MNKIVLTSLMAVFAVSGAHAANVINNNPLYRPEAGQFYSVTNVESANDESSAVWLGEKVGYGITDRLAVSVATSAAEADWFEASLWNDVELGLNFRALDMGNWKGDVFASYSVSPIAGHKVTDNGKNISFLDKEYTEYDWVLGVRAGYATDMWTVAGHIAFDYNNTKSFNWDNGDASMHTLRAGIDGQLVLNQYWNLTAGAEYETILDKELYREKVKHPGVWTAKFGANFNFDSDKFLGAYVTKEMAHVAAGDWEVEDGFGFGAVFGIQF